MGRGRKGCGVDCELGRQESRREFVVSQQVQDMRVRHARKSGKGRGGMEGGTGAGAAGRKGKKREMGGRKGKKRRRIREIWERRGWDGKE